MRSSPAILVLAILILTLGTASTAKDAGDALPAPADSAEATQPLAVGRAIPAATIRALDGKPVSLSELHAKELRLLVFYRGGW